MAAPMTMSMRRACSSLSTMLKRWKHLCLIHRRNLSYLNGNRNVLKLHDRGIFLNVFPEHRTPDLHKALLSSPQCFYCGFDPTADSLHVGNLLTVMALLHCQRGGHQVIALLGGATAQIGDPSGKTSERPAMDPRTIEENVHCLHGSLRQIFTNHQTLFWKEEKELLPSKILDNANWYAKTNVIQFLSTVGRHFRMGTMLLRESVQSRLDSGEGLSLTEFTYQAFQAYDWLYLNKNHNCLVQIGGNDQMGNILAGHDLISRVQDKPVFGLTVPLITDPAGHKIGKTANNAIWLNPAKTSPFELYQYFVRQPDSCMERYLKLFTFISDEDILSIMKKHRANPDVRKAQKTLAKHVTLLVHGENGLDSALRCSAALYSDTAESLADLKDHELTDLFNSASTLELFLEPGITLFDLVMKAKLFEGPGSAERIIRAGGIYLNHRRITNPETVLLPGEHILPNSVTVLRKGKKNYHIIKWIGL